MDRQTTISGPTIGSFTTKKQDLYESSHEIMERFIAELRRAIAVIN